MIVSEEEMDILIRAALAACDECYQVNCADCELKSVLEKFPQKED